LGGSGAGASVPPFFEKNHEWRLNLLPRASSKGMFESNPINQLKSKKK
jgi:hypothetical protein